MSEDLFLVPNILAKEAHAAILPHERSMPRLRCARSPRRTRGSDAAWRAGHTRSERTVHWRAVSRGAIAADARRALPTLDTIQTARPGSPLAPRPGDRPRSTEFRRGRSR